MNSNPYKAPDSNVVNEITSYPRKRNAWIWVIIGYQSLSVMGMLYSYVIIRGGYIPIPKQLQQYYNSLSPFDWAMKIAVFMIVVLSIIFLFRLSKLALRLFVAEVAISILLYVINYFKSNHLHIHNQYSWIGAVLGYSIMALIISYLSKLQKRGVLQ